eukprot:1385007-Lingulodinium_polyedra.AAC.1
MVSGKAPLPGAARAAQATSTRRSDWAAAIESSLAVRAAALTLRTKGLQALGASATAAAHNH